MRETNKLTVAEVSSLRTVGRYADGGGLYLQVAAGGSKQWVFRFMMDRVPRTAGLGSTTTFSLAEARKRAREFRQLVANGIDPIEYREKEREAARGARQIISFREAAERFIASKRSEWTNTVHANQWTSSLEAFVFPALGHRRVDTITTKDVLDVLEPIWLTKNETARRVRARIENILDWAKAAGLRSGENPADWGTLKHLLSKRSKNDVQVHHEAMPYANVPAFMANLRKREGVDSRALEFLVLAASRTNETRGALWSEIDLQKSVWTIPPTRMKGGEEHRVPLSDRAVTILKSLPVEQGNPHVFVGRAGKGLGKMALDRALKVVAGKGPTVHGMRSSFRDWCAEETSFPSDACEVALAHSIGDATRKAYERGDKLKMRRQLMAAWASYCESMLVDNVVKIGRAVA